MSYGTDAKFLVGSGTTSKQIGVVWIDECPSL